MSTRHISHNLSANSESTTIVIYFTYIYYTHTTYGHLEFQTLFLFIFSKLVELPFL